jgi:hypothetical protein
MDRPSPPRGRRSHAPWLRNDRWADGSIPDQSPQSLIAVWVFAILWNVVTALALIPRLKQAISIHDKWQLLALVFPSIGIGLLIAARRRGRRVRQFGPSVFHMHLFPASPAGDLAGFIHVPRPFQPKSAIQLRLTCINRCMSGMGRNARVLDHVIWRQVQSLDQLPPCQDGTDIPILFHLPPDASPTSDLDFGDGFRWKLEARCKTSGVAYYSWFEVPVFVVDESIPPRPRMRQSPTIAAPPAETHDPRHNLTEPGIVYEHIGGRLRIQFGAARNNSSVIGTTAAGATLIAIAATLALWTSFPIDRVITLCFAASSFLVGLVFSFIALLKWHATGEITARYGSLTVQRRALMFTQEQTFKVREVSDVRHKIQGGPAPKSVAKKTKKKNFYTLMLKTRDGDWVRLANDITQKDYAAWLAEEIKDTLGMVAGS